MNCIYEFKFIRPESRIEARRFFGVDGMGMVKGRRVVNSRGWLIVQR